MGDRLLLVLMIDALGHRLVRDTGTFRFLDAPDGPVKSVCGYSSACIPSLLTGKLPVEHGHWAMYHHDPIASVFRPHRVEIALLAGLLGRPGLARRWIARRVQRSVDGYFSLYEVPPRLLPHFDLCEKRDLFAAGAFPALESPFDVALRLGVPHRVWHWRTPEAQRRAELTAALRAGREAMLFFYSPLLDAVMHAAGTRSAATRRCLEELDRFARDVLALAAESYREVRLLVFGDHGMADVSAAHDLLAPLRALPWRMPRDYLYFIDSTMARFWYFRPEIRERVESLLARLECGRILGESECERLGVLFPDRRYGETVFLAHAGQMLAPSFMGQTILAAMHGYHPDDVDSDTLLLANYAHAPVHSILDIGPLLTGEIEQLAARTASVGKGAGR